VGLGAPPPLGFVAAAAAEQPRCAAPCSPCNTLPLPSHSQQDLISDLALAEEKIEAADQQLAADESEEAASGRDLRVLRQQLAAMRLALVEARARLAEQEARLTSCPADEGEAGKKQV